MARSVRCRAKKEEQNIPTSDRRALVEGRAGCAGKALSFPSAEQGTFAVYRWSAPLVVFFHSLREELLVSSHLRSSLRDGVGKTDVDGVVGNGGQGHDRE